MNPTMDAIYILSPQPHILDCLMADFERQRYRRAFLLWTGAVPSDFHRRLHPVRQQIAGIHPNCPFFSLESPAHHSPFLVGFDTVSIDFIPRESHLVTFRDPWSFPILYHPGCNNLVKDHLQSLAQKVRLLSLPPTRPRSRVANHGDRLLPSA